MSFSPVFASESRRAEPGQAKSLAFGIVLRAYRQEKGLVQEQSSERVNVVRSFICTLASGKKQPSLEMVLRLTAALGVKHGELVDAMSEKITDK